MVAHARSIVNVLVSAEKIASVIVIITTRIIAEMNIDKYSINNYY